VENFEAEGDDEHSIGGRHHQSAPPASSVVAASSGVGAQASSGGAGLRGGMRVPGGASPMQQRVPAAAHHHNGYAFPLRGAPVVRHEMSVQTDDLEPSRGPPPSSHAHEQWQQQNMQHMQPQQGYGPYVAAPLQPMFQPLGLGAVALSALMENFRSASVAGLGGGAHRTGGSLLPAAMPPALPPMTPLQPSPTTVYLRTLANALAEPKGDAWAAGAGPVGAGLVGAGQVGAGQVSTGQVGAGQVGAGPVGAGQVGAPSQGQGPAAAAAALTMSPAAAAAAAGLNPSVVAALANYQSVLAQSDANFARQLSLLRSHAERSRAALAAATGPRAGSPPPLPAAGASSGKVAAHSSLAETQAYIAAQSRARAPPLSFAEALRRVQAGV